MCLNGSVNLTLSMSQYSMSQIYPTTPMSEATSVEQLNSVTNRLFAPIIKRTRGLVNVRSLMMFLLELICIFDLIVNHMKR